MAFHGQTHPGFATVLAVACSVGGCIAKSDRQVVVYTAHDRHFSEPVLQGFERETGILLRPKFDVESTKSVGLATAIMAEARNPRCDVFWNNEILNTLRLKKRGLLKVCRPAIAARYPPEFRDPDGMWYGFAARARVLLVNTDLVPATRRPRSIYDLADPKWNGQTGIAKPLFGTTATHAACLFAVLGDQAAKDYFLKLKENRVHILSGNKQVATAVAQGQLLFGLTDTDDALAMLDQAYPVEIVYPDQDAGELGTLFIPNTVCVVGGSAHGEEAERLVEYLLSPEVEASLARAAAGQIPLNPEVKVDMRVETPATVNAMRVDFQEAASCWDRSAEFITSQFATADESL
jgi:iron(III) transport system substrate-binding protein